MKPSLKQLLIIVNSIGREGEFGVVLHQLMRWFILEDMLMIMIFGDN